MEQFAGTSRYRVVRQVGAGGMGVVYETLDAERSGRAIALKVLRHRDAESLVRLKREFRGLAELRHPNLVALYDLVREGDDWFFTMELVDGVDFLSWVRRTQARTNDEPTGALDATVRSKPAAPPIDDQRLRAAFRQLAEAVVFLHAQKRLHRDLKPSNVLVTAEGRVVVLDFGLVTELGSAQSVTESQGHALVGTAQYMAPEQAASGAAAVSYPADWYAFGVMLFEALTGRLPFDGALTTILVEKMQRPAPAPHELVAGLPLDLSALCVRLLRIDPAERPAPEEVLACFGATPPAAVVRRGDPDFIGRAHELEQLREALRAVRGGSPRFVRVLGESGIGKSALIRRFVQEIEAEGVVVLSGRCFERESVPYKALDSVIDELARRLMTQPKEWVDAVLPRDAHALAGMFPQLNRVDAFLRAPPREIRDSAARRRRAVAALRELLGRMSDRVPIVLVVDDTQWGDADSALVLDDVLRPPDAPAVLLLAASRSDTTPLAGIGLEPVDLELKALGPDESLALAQRALGDDPRAAAVARESGGNPFFLQQFAQLSGARDVRLEDVVATRLSELPPAARRLLDVMALAGAPLPEKLAARVAGLEPGDVDTVQQLKAAHLVRGMGEGDRLETWHDRIRETVARLVDDERTRNLHARLAEVLRGTPDYDVDLVAWHLGAAGLVEQAAEATLEAARRAFNQLAFERAAVLFRRVLELLPASDVRRREVAIALADSFADAGRGKAAAEAYVRALEEPGAAPLVPIERLELRRRSAEQLLRSGHIDAGLEMIRAVLGEIGMSLARTPRRAVFATLFRRLHLRLRGLSYKERPEASIPVEVVRKIDTCWSVSVGLAMVDTIRGASFQSRQLLLALDAGEPYRLARALASEAAFVAINGPRAERRAAQLIAEARALAQRVGDGSLLGLVDFCAGLTRFLVGKWREAAQLTAQAERQFTEQGFSVSWEAANSRLFSVWSLFYLGDVAGLSVRIPALTREAEQRGDRYAVTSLQCGLASVSLLAVDQPEKARAAVRSAMAQWPATEFHFQHYWALLSEGMIDLYEGRPQDSIDRLEKSWRLFRGSLLLSIQNVRVEADYLRARLEIAAGRLDEAVGIALGLEGENVAWARGFALVIRGLAAEPARAVELLRQALDLFDAEEMHLFAAATRLRLGEVQGGDVGAANVRAGLVWMQAQGVKDPRRFANVVVPAPPGKSPLPATTGSGSG